MSWLKQIVIGDGERGLLYRNRRFERVLSPGVHRLFDPRKRISVTTHNLVRPEYSGSDAEVLIAQMDGPLAECFLVADIGTDQVGLSLKNGKLEDVLLPGTRKLYWRGVVPIEVQAVSLTASLTASLELDERVAPRLRQLGLLAKVAATVDVPTESAGLLFVDGTLLRTLAPGAYAFWNFAHGGIATRDEAMKVSPVVSRSRAACVSSSCRRAWHGRVPRRGFSTAAARHPACSRAGLPRRR